jgi:hypothetical protein
MQALSDLFQRLDKEIGGGIEVIGVFDYCSRPEIPDNWNLPVVIPRFLYLLFDLR